MILSNVPTSPVGTIRRAFDDYKRRRSYIIDTIASDANIPEAENKTIRIMRANNVDTNLTWAIFQNMQNEIYYYNGHVYH